MLKIARTEKLKSIEYASVKIGRSRNKKNGGFLYFSRWNWSFPNMNTFEKVKIVWRANVKSVLVLQIESKHHQQLIP